MIAGCCSKKRSSISRGRFQRVTTSIFNLCRWRLRSFCFSFSMWLAVVLRWKKAAIRLTLSISRATEDYFERCFARLGWACEHKSPHATVPLTTLLVTDNADRVGRVVGNGCRVFVKEFPLPKRLLAQQLSKMSGSVAGLNSPCFVRRVTAGSSYGRCSDKW